MSGTPSMEPARADDAWGELVSTLLVRPALRRLFREDPESAHAAALRAIALAGQNAVTRFWLRSFCAVDDESLAVHAFGLHFPNPLGLAAGFDKNGVAADGLLALGFGHVELGTITQRPQVGNDKPRVRRLLDERAVINRLGFPNVGVEAFLRSWERPRLPGVIGINIGKGKDTALQGAAAEYAALFSLVAPVADYVAINVSSPNTLGLRSLQSRSFLASILSAVQAARTRVTARVPVLLKIAPDMTAEELGDVVDASIEGGAAGIIATNTTLDRSVVPDAYRDVAGGLSGAPLRARSTEVLRRVAERAAGRVPIIGVGGVSSVADAREKLAAGAVLVQLYTGLIFEGPLLARRMLRAWRDSLVHASRSPLPR